MILLLDIGNSRFKWGTFDEGELQFCGAIPYQATTLHNEFDRQFSALSVPSKIIVANVAGFDLRQVVIAWVEKQWEITPKFITPTQRAYGITNSYAIAPAIGADRWMALVAAWQRYHTPLCVISCGSAITIDTLNENGIHQGGLIAPGLMLMRYALTEHTHAGHFATPPPLIHPPLRLANTTESAINSGTIAMAAGFINQALEQYMNEEYQRDAKSYPPTVILTGGDADIIKPYLHFFTQAHPYLVLEGLSFVARSVDES